MIASLACSRPITAPVNAPVNPRCPEGGWGIANQQQTEQSFWQLWGAEE